jgi:hypothetical protein
VPELKQTKSRLYLDLRCHDYDEAIRRAIAAGAELADDVYDAGDGGCCVIQKATSSASYV